MDFTPNYYGLIFITDVSEIQYIETIEIINESVSKDLVNCLRETENYIGWLDSCLIISSPDIMDFLFEPKNNFAQTTIKNFPNKEILATYYYSVIEARGICKIDKGVTDFCLFKPELGIEIGNKLTDLEDNFMQIQFGEKLSGVLGKGIYMKRFNTFDNGKCI